jgi:hypothetical protein
MDSRIRIRIRIKMSWICNADEDPSHLKAGALVGQLPHAVQDQVHDLLADGVVTARVVVCRVLLALQSERTVINFSTNLTNLINCTIVKTDRNKLLWVEKLAVHPRPNLKREINYKLRFMNDNSTVLGPN